jgi:hypothetical protein
MYIMYYLSTYTAPSSAAANLPATGFVAVTLDVTDLDICHCIGYMVAVRLSRGVDR